MLFGVFTKEDRQTWVTHMHSHTHTHTHKFTFCICRYPSVDSTELPLHTLQHPSAVTYSPTTAYGTSKLCNILFTLELHRRFSDKGIFINAVHPGNLLATNLMRDCSCFYKAGFVAAKFFTKSLVRIVYQVRVATM